MNFDTIIKGGTVVTASDRMRADVGIQDGRVTAIGCDLFDPAATEILFSEGVLKGRIGIHKFVAVTATNHAKTYGLYPRKGTIAIGSHADIAIWDPDLERTVRHQELHDGADYSPYEGMTLRGWPTTVLLRGKVMVRDGQLEGGLGDGVYLSRTTEGSSETV